MLALGPGRSVGRELALMRWVREHLLSGCSVGGVGAEGGPSWLRFPKAIRFSGGRKVFLSFVGG